MRALDEALVVRMAGDSTLTSLLASYAGQPAIACDDRAPAGLEPPFIHIPPTVFDVGGAFDTKNSVGRQWVRDIWCCDRNNGDTSRVEEIAERVRTLFQRQAGALTVSGWAPMVAEASGPIGAPTDETLYGRIVTVTLSAMATS